MALLLFAGCDGDVVCACPPVDPSAHLVVQGVVQTPDGDPVEGAELSPLGVLSFDCAVITNLVWADPTPSVSAADGRFRLVVLTLDGAGVHCFDVLVNHPPSSFRDTIQAVGNFVPRAEIPDSVSLDVTIEDETGS